MIFTRTTLWRRALLILLLAALLWPVWGARAQGEGELSLIQVDGARFPTMRVYFEAYDASGRFIRDLKSGDVHVQEGDVALDVDEIERLQSGVQFIVALNGAPEMANRYNGVARVDAVRNHLIEWADRQPAVTSDDFSLSSGTGLQAIRLSTPRDWASAVENYQPNMLLARSSLTAISQAIDLATDPNPNPFMKRALLYITPIPSTADLEALPNLAARARQIGVSISVWLVGPASAETSSPAAVETLRTMTQDTGGEFFLFSGEETLPDLDEWLEPLRYTYQLDYTSRVQASGIVPIQLSFNRRGLELESRAYTIALTVEPPNPIFLTPPTQVERIWSSPEAAEAQLSPAVVPLQVMIEFPDEHPRPLTHTRLYVDGEMVVENLEAPFDQFIWDVSEITTSGEHILKVEAGDTLGLTGESIETPVQVVVEVRASAGWQRLFDRDRLVGYGAILLAGLILALAIVLRSRAFAHVVPSTRASRRAAEDPLTQPVHIKEEAPRASAHRPAWPAKGARTAPAWLVPLTSEATAPRPVPVNRKELTFGSDPQQALVALNAPSVSPLHARLQRENDGSFHIADCGSVAGTWVNYAPVSQQGIRLEHGDLIQMGRISYRFELAQPPRIPQPRVESSQHGHDSN